MVATSSKDVLRLEAAGHIDVTTLLPVDVSSLPRGLHARCIAFHPQKPMIAVGVQTCIGGYDLIDGVRVGRVDIRTPAVALLFSRDGSLLVVATQEWHIIGINTATWRSRVLAPMTDLRSGPLESIMMAITGGSKPVVFFTRYGKNSVRMAVNTGSSGKRSSERKLKWGVKLKLDVNKAVTGLAAHPTASQLLVLFEDGSLRSYALSSTGLQSIWPAGWMLPGDAASLSRLSLSQPPCQTLLHPFAEGAALLAIGSGTGSLLVLELVGKAEPVVVLKTVMPDNMPIVGLGVKQAEHIFFVFTATTNGKLRVLAWQMVNRFTSSVQSSGLAFEEIDVDADDIIAADTAAATSSRDQGLKAAAGPDGSSVEWQSLWGANSTDLGLETATDGSFLLDKLLAPVVQTAVLHPIFGCVAVQQAPPLALRQAANIMQQRLGLISAPEAVISRRTASVPLLRMLHGGQPGVTWPGHSIAAMHTGLSFWQTAAGLGPAKLQFPCHLYYLSGNKLSKYSLAAKRSGCFVELPSTTRTNQRHQAKHVVHSAKQHAWLVFFQQQSGVHNSNTRMTDTRKASRKSDDEGWHFTLITDSSAAGQASWFLPGKLGVFLGPQDLYFAIMTSNSKSISIYQTVGFMGKGLPLYTVSLARPSSLGAGLFAGPSALAVPYIGAAAAAKAAKEAAAAAEKAAQEAAAAAEEAAANGEPSSATAEESAETPRTSTAADPAPAASTGRHIRRPGETWRPTAGDDDDAEDMMIPVIGIGAAYQHAGQGGRGPNRFMASGYGQHVPDEQQDEAGEKHSGGGIVCWQQAGGKLVMGGLPPPGVQYAAGEDSDDPDADETDAATPQAPDMGQIAAEHSMQLHLNERVVSITWQNLAAHEPLEPYECAAAILTTQRLLLVSGNLTLLAAIDAGCGSVGLSNAITSYLWVGPALLYMTAGGKVMQLTWTGQTQHMASVSSYPPVMLAGALADSLLLVRQNPFNGEQEVASRAVGLLQPLVLGWTSLASCGLVPKGLNTARAALQALLEAFDASHVTSGMIWALIQGWCGDVAAALAQHATDVEVSVQLAANAAAGRWPSVVSALQAEHERSVFYPKPAPPGSQLHHKLLAAAAGAIMHGQFSCAQECLEAAGEWETAMALAVCAGDFAALRNLAVGLQAGTAAAAGGQHEAADIARLARALVAAYERNGCAFALVQGGKATDWKLRPVMADDSFFSDASNWSFGGPGKLPTMETSSFNAPAAFVQDGEVGPIPLADTTTLGAYLGNSDLVLEAAVASDQGPGARSSFQEDSFLANLDQLVALSSKTATGPDGLKRASSATSSISSDGFLAAGTAATAATAAAGSSAHAQDVTAFSDDDDDEETSFGYQQRKFRIHIKSKQELDNDGNPAAAGSTGASAAELRGAALKLKLGPPGVSGSFKDAFGKGQSKTGDSLRLSAEGDPSRSSAGAAAADTLYDLSFLAKSASSTSPGTGRPPKAPAGSSSGGGGGLESLSTLTGIASGLGGPAMKPKPQPPAPSTTPAISDEDFFSALAPVIPERTKSKLLSAPPPPPAAAAAAAAASSSKQAAAVAAPIRAPVSPATVAAVGSQAAAAGPAPAGSVPAAASAKPVQGTAATPIAGGDSTALYLKGVSEMEAARWDDAITTFSQTLQVLQAEPPGPATSQKRAFAAQYLAAVMLLKAAGAEAGTKEAKLYRYACALKLDDRHTLALVKESVVRNKHVKNFRYAADQLTWLVTRSLGSAPMEVMARLQEDIDECDRQGGRNASIASDEKVDEWVSIVAACVTKQDVEEVVLPLVQAAD